MKRLPSGGAFHAFPDVRAAISSLYKKGTIAAAYDIAIGNYLLEKSGVAVVPGPAFGLDGYIRPSFATSVENLKKALARIHQALA